MILSILGRPRLRRRPLSSLLVAWPSGASPSLTPFDCGVFCVLYVYLEDGLSVSLFEQWTENTSAQ